MLYQQPSNNAPVALVLVTPEIPANTGNIVRLCAAAAIPLHLVEPLGFSLSDRLAKRAGLDYWRHCQLTTHLTFESLEDQHPQARFLFLSARAERSIYELALRWGDFLVLGPEAQGLSSRFLSQRNRKKNLVGIPMPGNVRSLNLSTAAGIVVYEALRQLGALEKTHAHPHC
jgi:tRNA (cytidine/uridine-2'-O-)-methyltransferase